MKDTKTINLPGGVKVALDEDAAISVLDQLRQAFGWEGTEFSRKDVEDNIGRPLTEKEWKAVRNNRFWNHGIAEQATEGGWYALDNLISDLELSDDSGTI